MLEEMLMKFIDWFKDFNILIRMEKYVRPHGDQVIPQWFLIMIVKKPNIIGKIFTKINE